MCLQIVVHLQAMLHGAQKTVGSLEFCRIAFGQQAVLHEFFQGGQRLRILQKRNAPGVEQLERLSDELDFADAAASQFDVAIDFAHSHHIAFQAALGRGHLD